jgi:hypothetical protein
LNRPAMNASVPSLRKSDWGRRARLTRFIPDGYRN